VRRDGVGASLKRLPYLSEMASALLAQADTIILAGATNPVAFFALPGRPTRLAPAHARIIELAAAGADPEFALTALAEAIKAPKLIAQTNAPPARPAATGVIDPGALAQCIAATLPSQRDRLR
jgi:acetolactate synthase-1/2/3 large subunit